VPALIAAIAAVWSAYLARKNRYTIDTGNGRTIGETVHDMAQQQEIAQAIQHTNTRELVQLSNHLTRVETKIDYWIDTSKMAHDAINMRLDRLEGKGEVDGQ
jgi:hypothetical protein